MHLVIDPPTNGKASGVYSFRLMAGEDVIREWTQSHLNKRYATEHAVKDAIHAIHQAGKSLDYVMGFGASAMVCKRHGLRLRKNRPGAGQPKKPAAEKRVPINARVRPDVLAGFNARAEAAGSSLGLVLDAAFDATQPANKKPR